MHNYHPKKYSKKVMTVIKEYYKAAVVSFDFELLMHLFRYVQTEVKSDNHLWTLVKAIKLKHEEYEEPLTAHCYNEIIEKTVTLFNEAWPESPIKLPTEVAAAEAAVSPVAEEETKAV